MNRLNNYEKITSELLKTSSGQRRMFRSIDEAIDGTKKLNIDSFFKLLYSLFRNSNMLSEESGPVTDRGRFLFTEVFPDYPDGHVSNMVVTYELESRAPAVNSTKAIGLSTTQSRPTYCFEINNPEQNELVTIYSQKYENCVRLTCWSEKAADAGRLASTLENFFIKNYYILRRYVDTYTYEGRKPMVMSSDYGSKRLFGVPLIFKIRTDEMGYIRQDEITSIDVNIELVTSSELEELRIRS